MSRTVNSQPGSFDADIGSFTPYLLIRPVGVARGSRAPMPSHVQVIGGSGGLIPFAALRMLHGAHTADFHILKSTPTKSQYDTQSSEEYANLVRHSRPGLERAVLVEGFVPLERS